MKSFIHKYFLPLAVVGGVACSFSGCGGGNSTQVGYELPGGTRMLITLENPTSVNNPNVSLDQYFVVYFLSDAGFRGITLVDGVENNAIYDYNKKDDGTFDLTISWRESLNDIVNMVKVENVNIPKNASVGHSTTWSYSTGALDNVGDLVYVTFSGTNARVEYVWSNN